MPTDHDTPQQPPYALHRELLAAVEQLEASDKVLTMRAETLSIDLKNVATEVTGLKSAVGDLGVQIRSGVRALCVIALVLLAHFMKSNPGMIAPLFDIISKVAKVVGP